MKFVFVILFLLGLLPCVWAMERLEQFTRVYERESTNIEADFRAERLALPQAHVAALRSLEAHYQREGDLAALLALQEARQHFLLHPVPDGMRAVQHPPQLAVLQQQYRERFAAAATRRAERLAQLLDQYRAALGRLQTELTQQGDIDSARKIFGLLQSLPTTPGPAPQRQPAQRPAATPPPPQQPAAPARPAEQRRGTFEEILDDWF